MSVFHIIRVMSDIFDHVFEQVVAREYGVELARLIIGLKLVKKEKSNAEISRCLMKCHQV